MIDWEGEVSVAGRWSGGMGRVGGGGVGVGRGVYGRPEMLGGLINFFNIFGAALS